MLAALSLSLLVPSLLAASQTIDDFTDLSAWQVNRDGGSGGQYRPETELTPSGLRLRFEPAETNPWSNFVRPVTVPPAAVALTLRVRVLSAAPGAAMHLWLFEADGDAYLAAVQHDGARLDRWPRDEWLELTVPVGLFNHQPRGDGQRQFMTINRVMIGVNYAPLEVVVDQLAWVVGSQPTGEPAPTTAVWAPVDGPRGRVALLADPALPRTAGATDPDRLAGALAAAGYGVTRLLAGDLLDPARLARDTFDLLIVPGGPAYPAAGKAALVGYLKAGGAVLSLGGYAFDRPVAWDGATWVDLGADLRAVDMDRGQPDVLINHRIGKPGDTMSFPNDRITLFDPADQFERVVAAEWSGHRLAGALEGFVGRTAAGSNSPVFPDQWGEITELGQSYDRLGRPRGPLGVVAEFFAGPYAGAAWAGFGVTNRDLFGPDGLPLELLVGTVARLVDGIFVHSLTGEPVCLRDGETATLTAQVRNRGRRPATRQVRLAVNGSQLHQAEVAVAPGETAPVTVAWTPAGPPQPVEVITAELLAGDQVAMRLENGIVRWQPEVVAAGRRVEWRDNQLLFDGQPRFATGTNQTGVMWHSPRENPLTWHRDFQQMADSGHLIWRILHFSPFAQPAGQRPRENPTILALPPGERVRRQTDAIMQLAQQHGVVIMLCAHDWINTVLDEEQLDAQRIWNRFWADRYQDVPGLIWDIQNEPSVNWDVQNPPAWLHEQFAEFLAAETGSLAAGRELLGLAADAPLLVPLPGETAWDSRPALLRERFRSWVFARWVRENAAALRAGDPDALVTVGYLQSRSPADKLTSSRYLDFTNMHSYEPPRNLAGSLKFIDRRIAGGGLGLGEFGQRQSHDARANGQFGDRRGPDIARFSSTLATSFGLGGNMALNWCWRDLPDVIFPWGLHTPDRRERAWSPTFRAWSAATTSQTLANDPPRLAVLVPDSHRLGNDYRATDNAIWRSFDTLLGFGVPFAVLNEFDLEQVPEAIEAILWPVPYCPSDEVFATLAAWVDRGGWLFFSGGVGFDQWRRPTRSERWTRLGLPGAPAQPPAVPTELAAPVTAGRVMWQPAPVELGEPELVAAAYRQFLAFWGGDQPVAAAPGGLRQLHRWRRPDGHLLVATNWGAAQPVGLPDTPSIELAPEHGGLVAWSGDGRVSAVIAQGECRVGEQVILAAPSVAALALDGDDLLSARRVALLPLAPGELRFAGRLPGGAAWQAEAGEFVAGRWQRLETLPALPAGGALRIDEDLVGAWLLLTDAAADEAAAALWQRLSGRVR